jgi:dihydroorotate dehydrogenase electron transfer subunit
MNESGQTTLKGEYLAAVSSNSRVGRRFFRLGLEFSGAGSNAFGGSRPGQFAEVDLSGAGLPAAEAIPEELRDAAHREILLRRPFSFAKVAKERDKTLVDILYCVLGPATLRMTTLRKGDSISVIGPLGRGFWMPAGKKRAILVAGGMGAAPLLHLAQVLTAEQPTVDVIAFVGAKTAADLPFEGRLDKLAQGLGFTLSEFGRLGIRSMVATDDGSAGFSGVVTDCLLNWFGQEQSDAAELIMYACGPEPMLAKVAAIAKDKRIDCQVSMERLMACGIGVCQSCAVACKNGGADAVYKLCCKDGPVFDAKEVVFGS